MKEYKEAKKILDQKYAEAKKELADQIRPLFHKTFFEFFQAYPEVENITFELSADIYDDENYSFGVETMNFKLSDDVMSEDAEDEMLDYGWEDNAMNLEDASWVEDFKVNLDPKRAKEIGRTVLNICRFVTKTDDDFLKTVFGEYCNVKVTKEGFTVE